MLLQGKKLLVTGVLIDTSIAFHVARLAQEQGAEVVLTSFGRQMKLTAAMAKRLPVTPAVVELDVTNDDDLAALADRVREHVPHLDGVVHSIGFAPQGRSRSWRPSGPTSPPRSRSPRTPWRRSPRQRCPSWVAAAASSV
jgi:enoyl-[acyl-carrier-protein] reductase (NADH)